LKESQIIESSRILPKISIKRQDTFIKKRVAFNIDLFESLVFFEEKKENEIKREGAYSSQ
jgi:hypothetical protein